MGPIWPNPQPTKNSIFMSFILAAPYLSVVYLIVAGMIVHLFVYNVLPTDLSLVHVVK